MASTVYQDYNQNTPIVAAWLNDVNNVAYTPGKVAKTASQIAAAWVRFSVTAGVVAIQQSSNIATVVRNSAGNFTVTYGQVLTNTANCYAITQNTPGFVGYGAETAQSIVVETFNTSNVATDPGTCSVVIFGVN